MTDNTSANVINNMLRTLSTWILDFPAYWLLKMMYKIFFNVSTAELFTNATIKNFYSRIQLIIGVFMVFKLAVTILQGIVSPDKFTDKNAGFSSVITRIITSLIMLTLLVPINNPNAKNEYEKQLNKNGLLFGTLYSLQYRLLNNNTLGRLILGTTDNATTTSSTDEEEELKADTQAAQLEKSANIFTTTILKGFIRINVIEENADETKSKNWVCQNVDENILEIYTDLDADPKDILGLVNTNCDEAEQTSTYLGKKINEIKGFFKGLGGSGRYMFAYIPILPAIVGYVFVFILLGFTVDIAVRAVKLAVLRLIAPIPIISYIEPKQAKDGAFAAWCKTLISTYLDLFIRLAVVYFVIFLIQDMIVNGIVINNGSGMIGILSSIFIWIGLFFFARQAPKFIKDILGIKGNSMQNIGLSAMLSGVGALRQHGTLREAGEAIRDATDAQINGYNQGKGQVPLSTTYNAGRDHVAKVITGDPNMTAKKMARGERHLRAMGIDTPYANTLKTQMYDAQTELSKFQTLQSRAEKQGWANLSNADQESIRQGYRSWLDAWNKNHPNDQRHYSDAELEQFGATLATDYANTKYAKAKSKYSNVEGMQKLYGQARSFEAEYEGPEDESGNLQRRNFTNRAAIGLGRESRYSRRQQWRTQSFPESSSGATEANDPQNSGVDITPVGSTGAGPIGGGPGGSGGPAGMPPQ